MATEIQEQDVSSAPPTLDEGYWAAILEEGEHARPDFDKEETMQDYGEDDEAASLEDYYRTSQNDPFGNDWTEITAIAKQDEVIELSVVGYNRGGLLVEWRSLRGFVPASQLIDFPATANAIARRNAGQATRDPLNPDRILS